MDRWTWATSAAPIIIAAALLIGTQLYIFARWRRAPVARRSMRTIAGICLVAGFLAGIRAARVVPIGSSDGAVAKPDPAPAASPSTAIRPVEAVPSPPPARPSRSVRMAIYVAGDDRVMAFASNSNGDVPPLAGISGTTSGLLRPSAIAVDARGTLYVADRGNALRRGASVKVYAPGANGDVAPTATIEGPAIRLAEPTGIAVDSRGNIFAADGFVSSNTYVPGDGEIVVYSAGSNGNVEPTAIIAAGRGYAPTVPHYWIYRPAAIVLDGRGSLYVLNGGAEGVSKFSAKSNGRSRPLSQIVGPLTALEAGRGLAIDRGGNIFVTDSQANAVFEYAAGAEVNAVPIATILGPATGLSKPSGIALDPRGNIYVANSTSITVYAAGAKANASPIATISGELTQLSGVFGLSSWSLAVGPLPN